MPTELTHSVIHSSSRPVHASLSLRVSAVCHSGHALTLYTPLLAFHKMCFAFALSLTARTVCPLAAHLKMQYVPAPVVWPSQSIHVCMWVCRLLSQAGSPRSKKFKSPSGLPIASPVMDPGHLLTKLNADITQKHRHEFSLETCLGPTIFHRTKVACTCLPACLYV